MPLNRDNAHPTPPHFHKFKYKSEDYLIYSLTVKIWPGFHRLPLLSILYIILFMCAQEKENQLFEMGNKEQITFWMLN